MNRPLTVSEISKNIKEGLETIFPYPLSVKGEVSNMKRYSSGHAYFTLKDAASQISCVMWASYVETYLCKGKPLPKDGDQIIVSGRISVFPSRGSYQLSIFSLEQSGLGDALLALEELKKKLQKEGLFDESRKKKIPQFPHKVGVIAGKNSAGLKDIEFNIMSRWPLVELVVFPSLVQGKEAPQDLLRALKEAEKSSLDVLIVGRGGGSSEDLSAFNDESFVRALANIEVPKISAVGHEVDVTLTDYVADLRVSTPTAAAVAAVPNKEEVRQNLDFYSQKIESEFRSCLSKKATILNSFSNRPCFKNLQSYFSQKEEKISNLKQNLNLKFNNIIDLNSSKIQILKGKLNVMNPYFLLSKGYGIIQDENGNTLSSINEVEVGQTIKTIWNGGNLVSVIKSKENSK